MEALGSFGYAWSMKQVEEAVLNGLQTRFPNLEFSERRDGATLVIEVPSANPRVADPLRIECGKYPAVYWHKGYFCDFIWGEAMISHFLDFLNDFFDERVLCALGGPISQGDRDPRPSEEGFWVRSWRGTFDEG